MMVAVAMTDDQLPPLLTERLGSTDRDVRLAAVDELATIAAGADAAAAASAWWALTGLTDDDSRRVAAAATDALARMTVRLDPPTIDFGTAPPGSHRLVTTATIQAPRQARGWSATTTAPDLRVWINGDAVTVAWLPGSGRLDATVVLDGPGGEVVLPVTGEVAYGAPSAAAVEARRTARAGVGRLLTEVAAEAPEHRSTWRRRGGVVVAATLAVLGAGTAVAAALAVRPDRPVAPTGRTVVEAPAARPAPARPVSLATPVVQGTIGVGNEPEGLAVAPDSRTLYVANQGSHVLSVVDLATRRVISVALRNTARFVAVSRDGTQVFVSIYENDNSGSAVAVIDAKTRAVRAYLRTGPRPYALSVGPDGRLWVPIHDSHSIEIYSPRDQRPAGRIEVPANPHAVSFAADEMRAFTPDHESNAVSVIDMRTDRPVHTVRVHRAPHSLSVSPDGRAVVVACYQANAVDVIDTGSLRRTGPIQVGASPQGVAFATDSADAYVVNEGSDTLSVIDPRARSVTATIATGHSPRAVAVAPDGRFAYVSNGDDDTVSVVKVA